MNSSVSKNQFLLKHKRSNRSAPPRPWFVLPCLILLFVRGLSSIAVAADTIHYWYFTGTVTSVDPREIFAHVGDPYVLRIGFDTASANNTGISFPVGAMSIDVHNIGIGASLLGGEAFVGNDMPQSGGGSFDCFYLSNISNYGSPAGLALDGTDLGITLINRSQASTAGPFTSRNFPGSIDLSQFSERYMSVNYFYGVMRGTIDHLYIDQIPEPGAFSIAALGMVLCRRRLFKTTRA